MRTQRDIYIVSVLRGAHVQQLGPTARLNLTREKMRRLIRDRVNGGCIKGAKVWIETRRETARIAQIYGMRPRTLAIENQKGGSK